MNLLPIALLGSVALLFVGQGRGTRQLVKGQSYVAVLELPNTGITVDQLALVLPDGAGIQLDGRRAVVTFTAVTTAEMTDIPTPLGEVKVVSVRRVSDVVGAIDPTTFGRTWYTFSGWYPRPDGQGLKWSGWTGAQLMTFNDAMAYATRSPWKSLRAYRWDGKAWVKS